MESIACRPQFNFFRLEDRPILLDDDHTPFSGMEDCFLGHYDRSGDSRDFNLDVGVHPRSQPSTRIRNFDLGAQGSGSRVEFGVQANDGAPPRSAGEGIHREAHPLPNPQVLYLVFEHLDQCPNCGKIGNLENVHSRGDLHALKRFAGFLNHDSRDRRQDLQASKSFPLLSQIRNLVVGYIPKMQPLAGSFDQAPSATDGSGISPGLQSCQVIDRCQVFLLCREQLWAENLK